MGSALTVSEVNRYITLGHNLSIFDTLRYDSYDFEYEISQNSTKTLYSFYKSAYYFFIFLIFVYLISLKINISCMYILYVINKVKVWRHYSHAYTRLCYVIIIKCNK